MQSGINDSRNAEGLGWIWFRKSLSLNSFFRLERINSHERYDYPETLGVITTGVSAVGAVIPLQGDVRAAVSIGAIDARMKHDRRAQLGEYLVKTLAHPVLSAV